MRRRDFIKGIAGSAWPLTARAQQPGKLPTIGFLGTDASTWGPYTAAFLQRLRELGWIEGRTITIEYRWSEGRPERNAEIAAEFVRMKVDVIVTNAFAASTVQQATSIIPIVFPLSIDPVGSNLIKSLAPPVGNHWKCRLSSGRVGDGQGSGRGSHARPRSRATRNSASRGYCSRLRVAQGTSRRTLRCGRCIRSNQPYSHHHVFAERAAADNRLFPRICPSRGTHVLRSKLLGSVPAHRRTDKILR